jgi:CDP-glucose 4,6-dehydratase
VLEACRLNKNVQRIVVASSDKAYGVQKVLPYTEDSPLLGSYPYDASKACADIIARSYYTSFGLPIAVTRNANTYGGADLNFSRIIPDAICSILKNKEFVIRSDGTPERDYMYVKDAVNGYMVLAENLHRAEVKGQAFNFGTGKPINVLELFKKIAFAIGKKETIPKVLGIAKNEIDRQFLGIDKVKKLLNWSPKYSLDDGLKETVGWYINNIDTINYN